MRNFRSLEAAANRVEALQQTMKRVSANYSLGVDPRLLKDITEIFRTQSESHFCKGDEENYKDINGNECKVHRDRDLESIASNLYDLVSKQQHDSKIKIDLRSSVIVDDDLDTEILGSRPASREDRYVSTLNDLPYYVSASACKAGLNLYPGKLVSQDCRPLRERHKILHDALRALPGAGGDKLINVLDHFGIEVSMETNDAFDDPTRHLAMFFDSYFIADAKGDVLFTSSNTSSSHQSEYRRHRTSAPFANFAEIADLLFERPADRSDSQGILQEADEEQTVARPMRVGHSTVRMVRVDDIVLSVFIHPLTIDMAPVSGRAERAHNAETAYIVGVVRRSSLADEAIRLRLGPAADATLTIAMLLALLPILRFWATGDRGILGRFNLHGIGASAVAASALGTALAWGMVTKQADGRALDQRLAHIAEAVRANFKRELALTVASLEDDVSGMLKALREEEDSRLEGLERSLRCRYLITKGSAAGAPADRQRFDEARLLTSFLVDDDGFMEMCKRYRKRDSQKLNLSFRNYVKSPYIEDRPTEVEPWKRGHPFLQSIDSVVQGTKEIVVSFAVCDPGSMNCAERVRPKGKERPNQIERKVAVAVARFQSIDGPVLPPHFEYAVVDQAGRTIFHSDDDRVNVSNFIDDTGNDPAIQAAMRFGDVEALDATYDGLPIRASFTPLHEFYDERWTLVVFRSHGLVDRMSSLSTSLAIICWVVVALLVIGMILLVLCVRRLLRLPPMRPSAIRMFVDSRQGAAALLFSIAAITLIFVDRDSAAVAVAALLPFVVVAYIVISAWRRRVSIRMFVDSRQGAAALLFSIAAITLIFVDRDSAAVAVAALLPFVVVAYIVISAWRRRVSIGSGGSVTKPSKTGVIFSLAAIVVSLAVVPMLGWQVYFQAQVNGGLATYLQEEAGSAVHGKEGEFRRYVAALAELGQDSKLDFLCDSVAGYGSDEKKGLFHCDDDDDTQPSPGRVPENSGAGDGDQWFLGGLWPLVGYSSLSQEVMWHRSAGREAEDISSPADALDRVAGEIDIGRPPFSIYLAWVVVGLGFAIALLLLCYCVARTKFGHAERIALLPLLDTRELLRRTEPMRVLLVKQSENALAKLVEKLRTERDVKLARWDNTALTWSWKDCDKNAQASSERPKVYVVEDLRGVAEGKQTRELADKLRALPCSVSIIVCSDVSPAYHMRPGTLDDPDDILPLGRSDWRELLHDFEIRVLHSEEADGEGAKSSLDLANVMVAESNANSDLKHIADEVRIRMEQKGGQHWYSDRRLRNAALRQFRAMAQPKFKVQWAASSLDEKLQLVALARGGAPNIRQPAAVSSLANRGLITVTDPIQLRSEAFGQFIMDDLSHDTLDDWRRQGHHDWWRTTWLPLVALAVLGLLFFLSSNPEAVGTLAAIGAALMGLVPVIMSVLRLQAVQSTTASAPIDPTT